MSLWFDPMIICLWSESCCVDLIELYERVGKITPNQLDCNISHQLSLNWMGTCLLIWRCASTIQLTIISHFLNLMAMTCDDCIKFETEGHMKTLNYYYMTIRMACSWQQCPHKVGLLDTVDFSDLVTTTVLSEATMLCYLDYTRLSTAVQMRQGRTHHTISCRLCTSVFRC